uniref:Reverse transcriptase domain-containing protein n=1 Tax=Fagus sylvatica TaxID=28930 RepID=A0A2N9JAA2_FAGSY
MVPVGVVPNLSTLADIMCYRIGALPMSYLGMPLGAPFKSKAIWNSIVEKMERKLADYLSLFTIPASVNQKIEKIQRNFLWGGKEIGTKIHLLNWDTEEKHLWRRAIASKYGINASGWITRNTQGVHGCGLWVVASISAGWSAFI